MSPVPPPTSETRRRLTLQPPRNATVAAHMDVTRSHVIDLGEHLERLIPPGRELSLALTKLEEVCFWAIAAIARSAANS